MLVKTYTAALSGIDAQLITVEANHTGVMGRFDIVGLPDNAVKESEQRIRSALKVNAYRFPNRGIVINMAPADLKKEGAAFDLSIAIAVLASAEEVRTMHLGEYLLLGELSLDGSLQPIRGALSIAIKAKEEGFRGVILPEANAQEAAVVEGLDIYGLDSLLTVIRFLNGEQTCEPLHVDTDELFARQQSAFDLDFSDVRGQQNVRRALEVAAAGGHNMLMIGPPGAGKSMMAKRLSGILPPLTLAESIETTRIHSVAGLCDYNRSLLTTRPFRSPHHSITSTALVGGGSNPLPGEISLAHNGVLFLDELPEFQKSALEVMRQPMEDRKVRISRTKQTVEYPSSFMLVAAMNPCPCGYFGANNPAHPCTCTPGQIHRYMSKISGPLLDRIDIQCEIEAVSYDQLKDAQPGESSAAMRERVIKARDIQSQRYAGHPLIHNNAMMTSKMVRQFCAIDEESDKLLQYTMTKLGLSARAYDRILKVARTIADLDGEANIQKRHLLEAISYRSLDRSNWAG